MDLADSGFANQVEVLAQVSTEDSNLFVVYWRSGVNTQGRIDISFNGIKPTEPLVVAELFAMQTALETLQVIGNKPALSKINLLFSTAQPKRLQQGKSTKQQLFPWAQFLILKYREAVVGVGKDSSWIKPRADLNIFPLGVDAPMPLCIDIPKVGLARVTKAAADSFRTQMNNIEGAEAWRALERFILEFKVYTEKDLAAEVLAVTTGGLNKLVLGEREGKKQIVLMQDRGALAITYIKTY